MGKFEVDLILEVKKHKCLYNKTSIDFKKRAKKAVIWESIAKVLGCSTPQCQKKWISLRDTFFRVYKAQQMSDSRTATPIKWKYYDTIKYLSETSKFDVDCKEEPKEQPAQVEQIIELEPSHSTQTEKFQKTSRAKKKRQFTENTANTIPVTNLNDSYVLSPLHQFFNSIASQAEKFSRQKQLKLQMKCLKSLEEVELADSD